MLSAVLISYFLYILTQGEMGDQGDPGDVGPRGLPVSFMYNVINLLVTYFT